MKRVLPAVALPNHVLPTPLPGTDPAPIVPTVLRSSLRPKSPGLFGGSGYPSEESFSTGTTFLGNGPFSSSGPFNPEGPETETGPFSPIGPFTPTGPFREAPAGSELGLPAGGGLPAGDAVGSSGSSGAGAQLPTSNGAHAPGRRCSPTEPQVPRPRTALPPKSAAFGSSCGHSATSSPTSPQAARAIDMTPPTTAPITDQPPPPTGAPLDLQTLRTAGDPGVRAAARPDGCDHLCTTAAANSGSLQSKLPPPPSGAAVQMPPSAAPEAQVASPLRHPATGPYKALSLLLRHLRQPQLFLSHLLLALLRLALLLLSAPLCPVTPLASTAASQTSHIVPVAVGHPVPEPLTGLEQAARLDEAIQLGQALVANLRHVVLGTPGAMTAVAVAALCGGHLLIEDVPGVGKTVLAQALAASLGTDLSRLQGHPDLLPSDVTGVSVFSPDTGTWEFKPGPVFAHVVLVDELNRTPPRTQAALLETMEEQQVSADGESWPLPIPHLVIATQNPHSQLGTYPLVESQLDRFALATAIGYPDADVETQIVLQQGGRPALTDLRPVCTPAQWLAAQLATQMVVVDEAVAAYAVALCRGSRSVAGVRLGASPRAAIWLVRTAQAHAVLAGRGFVTPGDVKAMALSCLSHRLTTDEGVAFGVKVVRALLESTPAPRP